MKAQLFLTSPHSGVEIPADASWLHNKPKEILSRDLDLYVDRLYEMAALANTLPLIKAKWSRYVVDLNRHPSDVDQGSVIDAEGPKGLHPKGFHWQMTTLGEVLMSQALTKEQHNNFVQAYYMPFHEAVAAKFNELRHGDPEQAVYHLDCHSMPSRGTSLHPDPGQLRAEVVLGDQFGKSCRPELTEAVEKAFRRAGFQVVRNQPYKGGYITQYYGKPQLNNHTLQIELRRDLYMDETSFAWIPEKANDIQQRLNSVITEVVGVLKDF